VDGDDPFPAGSRLEAILHAGAAQRIDAIYQALFLAH